DDGGALKARMLADHRRQLKAVELGHADVDQDDRNLVLEQEFERFLGRSGLEQPLAGPGKNRLVAQQLGRLIVDQQDVYFAIRSHRASPWLSDAATCAAPTTAARC